jgi:selenocysteine-specific elongation factor
MHSIIIGTAGHIDHGKSSLVQALTGKDPDRLPEEKRRGITIDLGFADLDLGDTQVGFVDVPGHERFVKNMLAGVHGIDAVALVIAADEGVMPQTREHFEICRLLGVREGMVLITKTDLVEEELLSLVSAEAEELVAGSFLEAAPVLRVSARTGAGLDEFRDAIRLVAQRIPERSADFVTRLPIDRVFTMKGFGAVVTGTLVSGQISAGEELDLLPQGKRVRVRGVQVHGAAVEQARSGQRTAVNLAGIDVTEIERGMVLAAPGRLIPTQIIDVELNVLPTAPRPIRTRSRLRVHIGSAEVLARSRVLETSGEIIPGAAGFAQLRFETPVVALHDERFIIRSYSPSETIAGGRVLDPLATKHRGRELAHIQARLRVLRQSDRSQKVAAFVESAGDQGLKLADVAARTGWTDPVISKAVMEAMGFPESPVTENEGVLMASTNFRALCDATAAEVKRHHEREPLSRGLPRETLRERRFLHVPPEIFRAVILRLGEDNAVVAEKDLVRAKEHGLSLNPDDQQLRDKIAKVYDQASLQAPTLDQALVTLGIAASRRAHARKILQLLVDDGTLVRVQPELFFHALAIRKLEELLLKFAADHEPHRLIDVPKFKELAGVSRKYAIPLLEYFDSQRITVRAGDKRIILNQ